MVDTTGAEAWQRAHAMLLEKERHVEQLAVRHAKGAVTHEEFAAARAEMLQLRESANALFNAVFRFYEP